MTAPQFTVLSPPLAEMPMDKLIEINSERRYWDEREDRPVSEDDAIQAEMLALRTGAGDQFVLDEVADPYEELGKVADAVFSNWDDEAAIGRLVKDVLHAHLEKAAKRILEEI